MFNKLKEAIALAEAKEFEENALDLMLEDSVFDEDLYEFMKQDIVKLAENLEEDDEDFDDLAFYDEAFKFKKGNTNSGKVTKQAVENTKEFFTASPGDTSKNEYLGGAARSNLVEKIASGKTSKTLNKHFNLSDNDIKTWADFESEYGTSGEDISKGLKNLKNAQNEKNKTPKPKGELLKKIGKHIVDNKGKYALGATAAAAIGGGAYYLHQKNKAKKLAKKAEEKGIQESLFNFEFDNNGQIILYQEEIDFICDALDYELSENSIIDIISEGIVYLIEEALEDEKEEKSCEEEPSKEEKESKEENSKEKEEPKEEENKEKESKEEDSKEKEDEPKEEEDSKEEKEEPKDEELDEGCCKKAIKNESKRLIPVRGLIFESKELPKDIDKELDDDVEIEELLESVCEDF